MKATTSLEHNKYLHLLQSSCQLLLFLSQMAPRRPWPMSTRPSHHPLVLFLNSGISIYLIILHRQEFFIFRILTILCYFGLFAGSCTCTSCLLICIWVGSCSLILSLESELLIWNRSETLSTDFSILSPKRTEPETVFIIHFRYANCHLAILDK